MLSRKEIVSVLIIALVFSFSISLIESIEIFLYTLLSVLIIILINISAKKIISYYLESEIETGIWEIKRYGFKPQRYFKKSLPVGALLPIITTAISFGYFTWLASLVFEVKAKIYRTAKRHDLYTFSEMTEYHVGLIAASGILANLILAVAGYLIGFEEFAKLNIYYAFFNILPISDLDGNKIFFGSVIMWSFFASLILIGLAYAFLII
ncbi:hypothetical protein J4407_02275 [Candidatus Pacearchaeota archaeon]|nr:hypothetical protein [Candidatus Pacearchaeota archaeon]